MSSYGKLFLSNQVMISGKGQCSAVFQAEISTDDLFKTEQLTTKLWINSTIQRKKRYFDQSTSRQVEIRNKMVTNAFKSSALSAS